MLPSMYTLGATKPKNTLIETDPDKPLLSKKEARALKRGDKKQPRASKKKTDETITGGIDAITLADHDQTKDNAKDKEESDLLLDRLEGRDKAVILAMSQQSRFQTVTYDEYGKNVHLYQFTLSIQPPNNAKTVELLRDTELKLNYGTNYGLIGPNGIGKSTLLQAMGDGLVEGMPEALKILYVNQLDTSSFSAVDGVKTVLQTVLDADTRVLNLKRKIDILQPVLVNPEAHVSSYASHKTMLLNALLQIRLIEKREEWDRKNKIAIKRSGMLGKNARLRLLETEHEIAALEQEVAWTTLKTEHSSVVEADESEVLRGIHDKLEEYQQALRIMDEPSMEARARRILASMGVDSAKQESPLSSLSGGWQVRVLLARVLFMEPDFILLDEPTNHLDMPSILWLREYLSNIEDVLGTPVTLVLVSHDRFFLNALVDQIVQFRGWDKTLAYFDGNYDSYEETMLNKKKFNKKLQEKLDQRMENATKMVNKITQQGLKSKDAKTLQVAASKKKKMDRVGLERSEKGHRFMINRDRIGYFTTIRGQAENLAKYETETSYSSWKVLSMNPPQIRNITSLAKTTMISLEKVAFQYPVASGVSSAASHKPSFPLRFEDINLTINYGDKVILVGRNGAGKTTLMKMLDRALKPTSGKVEVFHGARIGSLMQHNVEDLKRHEWSRRLTPLELLKKRLEDQESVGGFTDAAPSGGHVATLDGKIRGHLSSFGVTGETAIAVPLEGLSGGQLVRVGLAWATYPYPPHVLLLDEPTNHMDMSTIQIFGEALRNYPGSFVLISHDLHFLHILTNPSEDSDTEDKREDPVDPVRVFEVSKKKGVVSVTQLVGGVDEYQEKEERRNASLGRV